MLIALFSFGISLLFILVFRKLFHHVNWIDKPHLYGYKRSPVPYGMGIVFFLVFLILSLTFVGPSAKLVVLLISGGILTLVSFWDDRRSLPPWIRLLIQLICAFSLVLTGIGVPAVSNPFGDPIVLDTLRWHFELFGISLTIEPLANLVALVWIVFVMNAMNWLDGAPGIVSGITTIACAVLYLLATMNDLHVIDQSSLSVFALIVGASSFAFLLFDFPKPKILMGDSGTMFLGLMIAVMAIFSGGKMATAFIVLAFPILDAAWTIVRRIVKGQSPFRGDFKHFHHELMRAGLSERQVNGVYYFVSLGFGVSALYLESFGKMIAIAVLSLMMISLRIWLLQPRFSQRCLSPKL